VSGHEPDGCYNMRHDPQREGLHEECEACSGAGRVCEQCLNPFKKDPDVDPAGICEWCECRPRPHASELIDCKACEGGGTVPC